MKRINYIVFTLFLSLVASRVIAQNIVQAVSGGDWFDPSIWSTQTVPSAGDNVDINVHTVFLQLENGVNELTVCNDLNIDQEGNLFIGHNEEGIEKWIGFAGSLTVNGTLGQGRGKSNVDSPNFMFPYNANLKIEVNGTTTISGTGFLNPKSIVLEGNSENDVVELTHYNVYMTGNLGIESDALMTVHISHDTFIRVDQQIGFSGLSQVADENTTAFDVDIEGVVIANNVNLYSKNKSIASKINIADEGSLFTQNFNTDNTVIENGNGGLTVRLGRRGLIRLGENTMSLQSVMEADPNFTLVNYGEIREHFSKHLETPDSMRVAITPFKPENDREASELKHVIGASHIGGWYNFTDKPYLLEGLEMYKDFGSTALKTSLSAGWGKMFQHYPFNHTWPNFKTMVDIAKYHMMDSVFSDENLRTHAVWANPNTGNYYKEGPDKNHDIYLSEEMYFYELTKYLLETYGDLDKRFVLQNWEGDWMLRGQGVAWEKDPESIPKDVQWRIDGMARMFRARMRGVERGRAEYPETTAEVLYSIEFNKLFDRKNGEQVTIMDQDIPGVLTDVIPQTRLDISSWSSYDGRWLQEIDIFPYGLLKGIRIAEYYTTNTHVLEDGIPVQLGEYGMNENEPFLPKQYKREDLNEFFSDICGLSTYTGIQQIYLWNFFCSGEQNIELEKGVQYSLDTLYSAMDGKWIIEPDQSYGTAGEYLRSVFRSDKDGGPTSIVEDESVNVLVYPNPTQGTVTLESDQPIVKTVIYTLTGKKVAERLLDLDQTLDVTQLPKGHYILEIFTLNGRTTLPLLKN